MKISKNLLIIILIGIIGVLIGYIIGNNKTYHQDNSSEINKTTGNIVANSNKLAKEYKSKVIATVIRENAVDLQKCYLSFLEGKEEVVEGNIKFVMKMNEDGSLGNLTILSNELKDIDFASCIKSKLMSYHFTPPPLGINRNIAHQLAFKDQLTAEKEAKAKAQKSVLPKVLPSN